MSWIETNLGGAWIFEPKIWNDHRGYFVETFNLKNLPKVLNHVNFVQDNESKSEYGVIRGLHFQKSPTPQAKLVRCVVGEVLDVIVDLRHYSPTFGAHFSVILNDITKKQLFVPRGFAHGYAVLSQEAIFAYKCDNYYDPQSEYGLCYDDKTLDIDWIIPKNDRLLSEKDNKNPSFNDIKSLLPTFF